MYKNIKFIHKGVDKEKIVHLFSKIDKKDLRDPNFEVPSLAGNLNST